jgi:UDP-glucose 4-epimerase
MKILVTGIAGMLGSHVAQHLLNNGHEVIGIDDLSGGDLHNLPKGAEMVHGSITDVQLVNDVVKGYQPEMVFHLAAYAAEQLSPFIRRFNYETNVIGSVNLINAAVHNGVRLFVFTSSIAVYGHGQPPFREIDTPLPADPYGIAKYAIERDLMAAQEMFGLNYVIFRPHNIYGENQNIGDAYRNAVGIFMNQCMQGKPMTIFGDGKQTRAFSYIGDVAPAIASVVERQDTWNAVFNIGGQVPYTVEMLATEVARQMEVKYDVIHLPARKEAVHAYCSQERAMRHFGDFLKNTPLHEGVARMAKWAKAHGARRTLPFTNIELHKNLPPSWAALLHQ